MTSIVPADMAAPNSQANANCFAWQQFIALNWVASPATCAADPNATPSTFGTPNDTSLVVWESYKERSQVFQNGAVPPSNWCAHDTLPAMFASAIHPARLTTTSRYRYRLLSSTSKFRSNITLSETGQAGTPDAWLTAQNGKMSLYEVRMNHDEFSFIVSNRLYDASTQSTFAKSPRGFNLPTGVAADTQYGTVGAIELKASWIELPDSSRWPFFKTSRAWVVYPEVPSPQLVTVGLTGLHIIHKTNRSPQLIWATFEHVNNAPSIADLGTGQLLPWYTFYNSACNPATDHYQCYRNAQPPGQPPTNPRFPQAPQDPYAAPVQVVRLNPISSNPSDPVVQLNQWVWQNVIRPANPKPVFLNYQLVDVLWSNAPVPIPPGATTPLSAGNPVPAPQTRIVANTTLETYFQSTKNCLFCHQYAPIATVAVSGIPHATRAVPQILRLLQARVRDPGSRAVVSPTTAPYASDYSFLFSEARTSQSRASPRRQ